MGQRRRVIDDGRVCGANAGRIRSGNSDELSESTNVGNMPIGGGQAERLSMCGTGGSSAEKPNTHRINRNSCGAGGDGDGGL